MTTEFPIMINGNRQGNHTSGAVTLPVDVGDVTIRLDIDPVDYVNPENFVRFSSEISLDGGQTWGPFAQATWDGGPYTDDDNNINPPPIFAIDCRGMGGQRVRLVVEVPQRMRFGATVTA